jgi:hypothetical protein
MRKNFLLLIELMKIFKFIVNHFVFQFSINEFFFKDILPNVDGAIRRSIHGIIGIINLIAGPYLIVITSKVRVGDINGQTIYKVQTTEMIPYARNMSHLNEYQVIRKNFIKNLISLFQVKI